MTPVLIHGMKLKELDRSTVLFCLSIIVFPGMEAHILKKKPYQRHFNLREVPIEKRKGDPGDAPCQALEIFSAESCSDNIFLPVQ